MNSKVLLGGSSTPLKLRERGEKSWTNKHRECPKLFLERHITFTTILYARTMSQCNPLLKKYLRNLVLVWATDSLWLIDTGILVDDHILSGIPPNPLASAEYQFTTEDTISLWPFLGIEYKFSQLLYHRTKR